MQSLYYISLSVSHRYTGRGFDSFQVNIRLYFHKFLLLIIQADSTNNHLCAYLYNDHLYNNELNEYSFSI